MDQLSRHYEVSCIAVLGKHAYDAERASSIQQEWEKRGVCIKVIKYVPHPCRHSLLGLWRILINDAPHIIGDCVCAPELKSVVKTLNPDILIGVAHLGSYLMHDVPNIPKLAILSEGYHVNLSVWKAFQIGFDTASLWKRWWKRFILQCKQYVMERAEVTILRKFELLGFKGQHYIRWAKRKGLTNIGFIPTPVKDPHKQWQPKSKGRTFRILMIGHLRSTNNQAQLPFLVKEVLPALATHFKGQEYVVRIVGSNAHASHEIDILCKNPHVDLVGPVFPPNDEYLNCDVLFVPAPALTGPRVRIIQGFAFGCPVVAHSANALGIAELCNGGNVLLGDTGDELAQHLRCLCDDRAIAKRLGVAGRTVYEACYAPEYCVSVLEHYCAKLLHNETAK